MKAIFLTSIILRLWDFETLRKVASSTCQYPGEVLETSDFQQNKCLRRSFLIVGIHLKIGLEMNVLERNSKFLNQRIF